MPAPELLAVPPRAGAAVNGRSEELSGWGGVARVRSTVLEPRTGADVRASIAAALAGSASSARGVIARGMGRSYGDAAQREGGIVVRMRSLRSQRLDPETGILDVEAGATLGEILASAMPEGWVLPVIPGTQRVTVAGAIASDVHGKNHGRVGSFSQHLRSIEIALSSGEIRHLTPADPLFWATAGGMGLTGVILSARVQLHPVGGPLMSVDTDRVRSLEDAYAALRERGGSHRVAWIDLATSARGRGFVTRAEHLHGAQRLSESKFTPAVPARAEVPPWWPQSVLRLGTIRAYNELRYRTAPKRARGRVQALGAHLFPLDALGAWPRLYGPSGLIQYQFVVPYGHEDAARRVIELLHARRIPPFLTVLKDLGAAAPGPLSFPLPGWAFALDFPRAYADLVPALHDCDEIVAGAGGRVYLAKDICLRPGTLAFMYPELGRWRELQAAADPAGLWCSDLALRTGLLAERR